METTQGCPGSRTLEFNKENERDEGAAAGRIESQLRQ